MFIDSCRMRTPRIEANAGLRAHMRPARWLSMCDCATGWNVKPKAEHTSPSMSTQPHSVPPEGRRGGVAYVPLDPPENVDICVITPTREVISPAAKSFAAYAMGFISEL